MKLSILIIAILIGVSALGIFLDGPLGDLFKLISLTAGGAGVAKKIKDQKEKLKKIEEVEKENARAEESARQRDKREVEQWLDKW
jgi:hypothetical protein